MVEDIMTVTLPLRPCPFCGGTRLNVEVDPASGLWKVDCDNYRCAASGPQGFATPAEAAAAWNRRAIDPRQPD